MTDSSKAGQIAGTGVGPDEHELAELFARHRDRLRRMVQVRLDRRLQGRVDPSDVLQEAQLDVLRRAAEYAHGQGVLHRDIKPSNLLLDLQGMVWVTDFGLAKATADADLTHTGDIVGTLRYMAPKRFNGQADAQSDIYALGLTLYELLTLRPAFSATDRNRLIQQVTEGLLRGLRSDGPLGRIGE